MARVVKGPKPASVDEMAVVYASLILIDDDLPVTEDKIKALLAAADCKTETIWPSLFAKALQGMNVKQLITAVSGAPGGGGGVGGGPLPEAAPAAPPAEEKKEEEKKPEPEEEDSDEDMGFGLFD